MLRWELLTIGHSNRSPEELVRLLKQNGVELVVDVRRFPSSRQYPYFQRDQVAATLQAAGIAYCWMGDLLGGFRTGGYEGYMGTEAFNRGLELLLQRASQRRAAVMCAERLFFRCHRRFIADACVRWGWRVLHIVDEGRVSAHRGALAPGQLELDLTL
ncbi:MAG: DUF488 family protein [candidate division KSB1 bacterium]|nr:DUF488 family protein [candidate division KSB1 bacterium]